MAVASAGAICKSAPRSSQITTPVSHHSVFLQAGCPLTFEEYWYVLEYKAPLFSTCTSFLQPSRDMLNIDIKHVGLNSYRVIVCIYLRSNNRTHKKPTILARYKEK